MQRMQRGNEKLKAYLVFQTKLAAGQIIKKILKIRDIAVSLNDQIKDYYHLTKTTFSNNTSDNQAIQQYYGKNFVDSSWGSFIKNDSQDEKISFYNAGQQLTAYIEELKKIKANYKKLYKYIPDDEKAVNFDKDKFVLMINHGIVTAERLIQDLQGYNIDKYKMKAEDIIKKSALPANNGAINRIKISWDENTKNILIQLKERELNFTFRNVTVHLSQIFHLIMSYLKMSDTGNSANLLSEKLFVLCEKLAKGKNLKDLSETENEIDALMSKNHNEIELQCIKLINLHMILHECANEVVKFVVKINSLSNHIISDLAKLRGTITNNHELGNALTALQRMMSMFRDDNAYKMDTKSNFIADFNEIDKAFKTNHHLKKIKALHPYLNTIRRAVLKEIDFFQLMDLRNLYYLLISDYIGASAKLADINNKDIAAVCRFKIVYTRLSTLRSMIQQDFKNMLTASSTDETEESLSESSNQSPLSLDLAELKKMKPTDSPPASSAATPTSGDETEDDYSPRRMVNKRD